MPHKLIIFDSHPVQYKAPVYQELERLKPGAFKVVYATDCSVRGFQDRDFGQLIAWDSPLMEGYEHAVLNNECGVPLRGFRSLTGRGIFSLLRREKPAAALISQFLYESDFATYFSCMLLGIPIWIRHETQDEAFTRPPWKKALRKLFYRAAYSGIDRAFYIGALNREHLLRHGLKEKQLTFSPYCVSTPLIGMDAAQKTEVRKATRKRLQIADDEVMLLFSGKLIEKKNPGLVIQALQQLAAGTGKKFKLVFVGSGVLQESLRQMAENLPGQVIFTGFINQSEMPHYYLAADIMILPSRRMGETWGLVVNEALHAGCGVVMTDAVGCHREFGSWERVRVIGDGDAAACAKAITALANFPRSFDWCRAQMEQYTVHAAAAAIAGKI